MGEEEFYLYMSWVEDGTIPGSFVVGDVVLAAASTNPKIVLIIV
jgi:hypothetical protein